MVVSLASIYNKLLLSQEDELKLVLTCLLKSLTVIMCSVCDSRFDDERIKELNMLLKFGTRLLTMFNTLSI